MTKQTLVTISLGLKETACFSLESNDIFNIGGQDKVYGISLDDVKSVLQYKNSYSFGIPNAEVKCVCDCPGAEDFCKSSQDMCAETGYNKGTCYNWYRDGLSSAGCTGSAFLAGSAEVCCSISIVPANRTIWKAVELTSSSNRAVFTVTSLSTHESKTTEVDIEGGHPIISPFYFTVNAPAISAPVDPGWYFGPANGDKFYGGIDLNGLSEYDLTKLGWYKIQHGSYTMDRSKVLDSFKVEVSNCDKDELVVEFDNKVSQKSFDQAVELGQLYKTELTEVTRMDDERRIEAYFRQYSNIELTLTLQGDYRVVQIFDISHFQDFEGVVMMDKHSNYFVNITVFQAEGSIRGNLTIENAVEETEIFKINIPEDRYDSSTSYIKLGTICEDGQHARLCLYTDAGWQSVRCKRVQCDMQPLKMFELPDSDIAYEKGEKMSILSLSTWAKHLNPLEWFNGITNWKEGVIMMTEIFGVIAIIGIVLKVLRVFGCLAKCCSCINPFKKRNRHQRFVSSDSARSRKRSASSSTDAVFTDNGNTDNGNTMHYNRSFRSGSGDNSYSNSPSYMCNSPRFIPLHQMQDSHSMMRSPHLGYIALNPVLAEDMPHSPYNTPKRARTLPCQFPSNCSTPRTTPPRSSPPGRPSPPDHLRIPLKHSTPQPRRPPKLRGKHERRHTLTISPTQLASAARGLHSRFLERLDPRDRFERSHDSAKYQSIESLFEDGREPGPVLRERESGPDPRDSVVSRRSSMTPQQRFHRSQVLIMPMEK